MKSYNSLTEFAIDRIEKKGYIVDSSVRMLGDDSLFFLGIVLNEGSGSDIIDYFTGKDIVMKFVRKLEFMYCLVEYMAEHTSKNADRFYEALGFLNAVIELRIEKNHSGWAKFLRDVCIQIIDLAESYYYYRITSRRAEEVKRRVMIFFDRVKNICEKILQLRDEYFEKKKHEC